VEYSREQYQLSIEELQKKLEQNPHDDAVAFEYAEKQYQLGNLAQSQELLMPLLVRDNPLPQAILLLAQMQYVCGNYAEAEALFLALGTRFPEFSKKAEFGLGLVYYQTNQFKKALALSTNSPDNIIAILQAYGDIEPYRVEWGEAGSISIPFFRTEPVPVIQAEIAGKLYNFIIDSGVGDIHLDESLAASLGIDILGKYMGAFAGGEAAEIQYGLLKSMALKDLRIESVPVSLLPSTSAKAIAAVFKKEKLKIDGIMGVSVFKQFMTTLDYPASRLILRPKDAQMDENASEMPFMLAFTHFIMGRGEINGKEVNIFLNSGLPADAALILPDDTVH
jgi:tetratricopeptide (TPR) repeat protein